MIYDAAVVGLGTMGAFACRDLARRGLKVIGLDQFSPPHDRGSHTGDTRVFRTAYAEHPDYVPLAIRAGVLWDQLGAEENATFLHRTGLLSVGEPGSSLISGARLSARLHGLELKELDSDEVRTRFPAFRMRKEWESVFEPAAGWLDVNGCLHAALHQAERTGAELRRETAVVEWNWNGQSFELTTSGGAVNTKRLVITAGAWAGRLLSDVQLPLTVVRKLLVWVDPLDAADFTPDNFPVFASAENFFYGFPNVYGDGVKLAIHWSEGGTDPDIDAGQTEPSPDEIAPVLHAASTLFPTLAGNLPEAFGRVVRTKTCFYTMTPDEHFLIDRHPSLPDLVFAAGFSGHGFKFAPAIGEALAQLAVDGLAELPIDFLSLRRFDATR